MVRRACVSSILCHKEAQKAQIGSADLQTLCASCG
jgi:hypothetical protein